MSGDDGNNSKELSETVAAVRNLLNRALDAAETELIKTGLSAGPFAAVAAFVQARFDRAKAHVAAVRTIVIESGHAFDEADEKDVLDILLADPTAAPVDVAHHIGRKKLGTPRPWGIK